MDERITVDAITYDPNTNELVLYFVEDGPWPQDAAEFGDLLKRIQDKILDAADAAIDGGIAAVYPDSAGKKIRIQIDSPNGCPEKLGHLVRNVDKYLTNSQEYDFAIRKSQFITGIRVVTGHMVGRFKN